MSLPAAAAEDQKHRLLSGRRHGRVQMPRKVPRPGLGEVGPVQVFRDGAQMRNEDPAGNWSVRGGSEEREKCCGAS